MSTKVCRLCGKEKSIDSFYRRRAYTDGYAKECKICINIYNREYRNKRREEQKPVKKKERPPSIRLNATRPEDYCEMWDFLASCGYDVQGNVHLQFCLKYGLTPDTKLLSIKKRLSYTDCLKLKDPN